MTLLKLLDEEIRETESFVAHQTFVGKHPERLMELRAVRAALAKWERPASCRCSRGGLAANCECHDWPDEKARRILRENWTGDVSVGAA
jgi:hypothetical protein